VEELQIQVSLTQLLQRQLIRASPLITAKPNNSQSLDFLIKMCV